MISALELHCLLAQCLGKEVKVHPHNGRSFFTAKLTGVSLFHANKENCIIYISFDRNQPLVKLNPAEFEGVEERVEKRFLLPPGRVRVLMFEHAGDGVTVTIRI